MKHIKLLEAFEEEMQQGMQPEAINPKEETGPLAVVCSYPVHGEHDSVGIAYFTNMESAMKKFMQEVENIEEDEENPENKGTVYICRLKEGDEFDYSAAYDDYFGDPYDKDIILSYDSSSPNKYVMG